MLLITIKFHANLNMYKFCINFFCRTAAKLFLEKLIIGKANEPVKYHKVSLLV